MRSICQTIGAQDKTFILLNKRNKDLEELIEDIKQLKIVAQVLNTPVIIHSLPTRKVEIKKILEALRANIQRAALPLDIKDKLFRIIILRDNQFRGLNLVFQIQVMHLMRCSKMLEKVILDLLLILITRAETKCCLDLMALIITLPLNIRDTIITPKKSLAIVISTVHNILQDII